MEERNDGKYNGRYYKQGPVLAYKPEEDVVYDDRYKVPLEELLVTNKPRTVPEIKNLLDDNGYVGRHSVRKVYQDGCYPLNDIRIRVSLIWSELTYLWPYQGVYSVDFHKIVRNKTYDIPNEVDRAIRVLYKDLAGSPYVIRDKLGITLAEGNKLLACLIEMGLVKDYEIKIVDDLELEEVINNLLIK